MDMESRQWNAGDTGKLVEGAFHLLLYISILKQESPFVNLFLMELNIYFNGFKANCLAKSCRYDKIYMGVTKTGSGSPFAKMSTF